MAEISNTFLHSVVNQVNTFSLAERRITFSILNKYVAKEGTEATTDVFLPRFGMTLGELSFAYVLTANPGLRPCPRML